MFCTSKLSAREEEEEEVEAEAEATERISP